MRLNILFNGRAPTPKNNNNNNHVIRCPYIELLRYGDYMQHHWSQNVLVPLLLHPFTLMTECRYYQLDIYAVQIIFNKNAKLPYAYQKRYIQVLLDESLYIIMENTLTDIMNKNYPILYFNP